MFEPDEMEDAMIKAGWVALAQAQAEKAEALKDFVEASIDLSISHYDRVARILTTLLVMAGTTLQLDTTVIRAAQQACHAAKVALGPLATLK